MKAPPPAGTMFGTLKAKTFKTLLVKNSISWYNYKNIEYRRKVSRTGVGKQFESCSLRLFFM